MIPGRLMPGMVCKHCGFAIPEGNCIIAPCSKNCSKNKECFGRHEFGFHTTEEAVAAIRREVQRLRSEGWSKEDFAKALKEELND